MAAVCPACGADIEIAEGMHLCACPKCKKKYLVKKLEDGSPSLEEKKPGFLTTTVSPLVQYLITAAVIAAFAYFGHYYMLDLSNVIPGVEKYVTVQVGPEEEEAGEAALPPSDNLVSVDPFSDVTILFRGVNGRATACANIVTDNEAVKALQFSLEPSANLKSGDKMTLRVVSTDEEIRNLGLQLTSRTKEYLVGSLDSYVSYFDEIPDEVLGKIFLAGMDELNETYHNYGGSLLEDPVVTRTQGWSYSTMYLLNNKEDGTNFLFVRYKSKYTDGNTETEVYNTVRFRNIVLKTDGSVACTYAAVPSTHMFNLFGSSIYGVYGFGDTTTLFNEVIRPYEGQYTWTESDEAADNRMIMAADSALAARLYAQEHPAEEGGEENNEGGEE